MTPILTFGQRQQAMRGLPFYGKGDFNFVASRSGFSNGIAISILPLSDLSRPQQVEVDGSRLTGVKVNSTFKNKKHEPENIIGKFEAFKIDKKHKTIRAFIRDPKTMEVIEVYPETLNRLNESKSYLAKTFLDFVI
jgi:hypothetical protein